MSLTRCLLQVTVLLGHNGAGKSTTMSIMVGLFPPSSGDVLINGHSVTNDLDAARSSLGLCPQFDVLFDTLTVEDHLYFFGRLKGLDGIALSQEIDDYVAEMDLESKRKSASNTLSGGQKRALSVAIALIGGSETVVLDEPTSGMDPEKRRHTWQVLLKHKEKRTILLTTHFMDEADLLGDRIAIMSDGSVQCCGSSSFLKSRFGVGYHLTMLKAEGCDPKRVVEYLQTMVPSLKEADDLGQELACTIPAATIGELGALSLGLEREQEHLGVLSFGLGLSTMEEVFLNVGHGSNANPIERKATVKMAREKYSKLRKQKPVFIDGTWTQPGIEGLPSPPKFSAAERAKRQGSSLVREHEWQYGTATGRVSGPTLKLRQLRAMFGKRMMHSARKWKTLLAQTLLPVLFVVGAMEITKVTTGESEPPCYHLSLWDKQQPSMLLQPEDSVGNVPQPPVPAELGAVAAEISSRPASVRIQGLVSASKAEVIARGGGMTSIDAAPVSSAASTLFAEAELKARDGYYQQVYVPALSFEQGAFRVGTGGTLDPVSKTGDNKCWVQDSDATLGVAPTELVLERDQTYLFIAVSETEPGTTSARASAWGNGAFKVTTTTNPASTQATVIEDLNDFSPSGFMTGGASLKRFTPTVAGTFFLFCGQSAGSLDAVQLTVVAPGGCGAAGGCSVPSTTSVTAWYTAKSFHAAPTALATAENVIARRSLSEAVGVPSEPIFSSYNCPLPATAVGEAISINEDLTAFYVSIFLIFALSFLVASFGLFIVDERVSLAKHVQMVSGVSEPIYWTGTLAWDFVNISICNCLIIIVFAAYEVENFTGDGRLGTVFFVLELFGLSVLPLVYLLCFAFSTASAAYARLSMIFVFFSFIPLLAVTMLSQAPSLRDTAGIIKYVGLINPLFAVSSAIYDIYRNQQLLDFCSKPGNIGQCGDFIVVDSPLEWDGNAAGGGVGKHCVGMAGAAAVYFCLLLAAERGWLGPLKWLLCCCGAGSRCCSGSHGPVDGKGRPGKELKVGMNGPKPELPEDDDVAAERQRIARGDVDGDLVVVKRLVKTFGRGKKEKTAVSGLDFAIKPGECFGLLGVNGAGKTTTFKMLTGETKIGLGSVAIEGVDLAGNLTVARKRIGYCPQFGGLINTLTAREHLYMYARLRGVPEAQVKSVAHWLMNDLNLLQYADRVCGNYSGGQPQKTIDGDCFGR